ncbi:uncharacterized protein LOC104866120 [Fukomys damarensis]|uniref:uncharacterized protein LOC104866120 n=1 Tax=Fukomys damarensis TaxID=885580 RepID=UPI001455BD54|nr:uncharacterized protein LOC104866120 [Fukomys damarensis]
METRSGSRPGLLEHEISSSVDAGRNPRFKDSISILPFLGGIASPGRDVQEETLLFCTLPKRSIFIWGSSWCGVQWETLLTRPTGASCPFPHSQPGLRGGRSAGTQPSSPTNIFELAPWASFQQPGPHTARLGFTLDSRVGAHTPFCPSHAGDKRTQARSRRRTSTRAGALSHTDPTENRPKERLTFSGRRFAAAQDRTRLPFVLGSPEEDAPPQPPRAVPLGSLAMLCTSETAVTQSVILPTERGFLAENQQLLGKLLRILLIRPGI